MPKPREAARVAVLAGSLAVTPAEPTSLSLRTGPALHFQMDRLEAPLDLRADRFRYFRITPQMTIAIREGSGLCRLRHRSR